MSDRTTRRPIVALDDPFSSTFAASYAGVVVKASAQHAAAHAFLDWLRGPDGRSILDQFGFLPPAA